MGGRAQPGSRLKVAAIAKDSQVSLSVVREALTRLMEQGLVVSTPHAGFYVKSLSTDDLEDLTQTRIDIDVLALRRSLAKAGVDWEAQLVAAHHTLSRTPPFGGDDRQVTEDWALAHAAFHEALIAGCGSQRLLDLAASLRDAAELYRRASWRSGRATEDVLKEHRDLLEASLARDVARAEGLLTEHLQRTADVLLDELRKGQTPTGRQPSAGDLVHRADQSDGSA
jgi:DNA-binding GntR family transcriptional regulator